MPPWRPCPRTSITFIPMIPISESASLTAINFSSRKMASIFFVMIDLLLYGLSVSPLTMFANVEPYFFFVFGDTQTHKPAQQLGEHKCDAKSECNGYDRRHCLDQ